jgi:hypothetical protein
MPTRATYSLASMAGFPGVGLVGNAGRGIALYPLKSERAEVEIEELGLGRPPAFNRNCVCESTAI